MIYHRFTRFQNICLSLLLASQLSSCSTIHDFFWSEEKTNFASPTREKRKEKAFSSSYEWAVQNFEAGSYEEAIRQFTALKKGGAEVSGFELISYYLGMSYSRRGNNSKAKEELERYLLNRPKTREGIEARMALLLIYEKEGAWDNVVALAAETDQLQVFQENRALLKLIWARALREKGELLGARAAIKDAKLFIENTPEEGVEGKDIWGRFRYVQALTQLQECQELSAKLIGKKKLYGPWLEAEVDCWKSSFESGVQAFRFDNSWTTPTEDALEKGIDKFGLKIKNYLAELKALEPKRNLQKLSRQQIYRTMEAVDANLKDFKERTLNSAPLEQLRKKIDLLLVSI